MKRLLTLALAALCALSLHARTVKGHVYDKDGLPLEGVTVMYGSGNGTMTKADGSFSLNVPDGETVNLEFHCLGYVSVTISVSPAQNDIDVVMEDDDMVLEETVVIGYGTTKKINLTGAVTAVSSRELSMRTSPSLTHMLQGAVPGLYVTTSSGNPSNEASINIRGYTSINGGSPLVIVDGVNGDLAKVNPADVESISVIKDASSSAIYGARAAYGVILVTTKSGLASGSAPVVRYNGHIGFTTPTTCTDYETRGYDTVNILDTFWKESYGVPYSHYTQADMQELLERRNDVTENPERPWVLTQVRGGKESYIYYCNTDWYHTLYTDFNPFTHHNISVSGGDKYVKYYFSGGYEHKQGTFQVRPEQFDKYNLRSKLDFNVTPWLSVSNNMSFYSQDYDYPGNASVDYTFGYSSVHALASLPPRNPDGTWVYKTIFSDSNVTNGCHIELGADTKYNFRQKQSFSNTLEISIHPIPGLDIRANYTYTKNTENSMARWTNASYSKYPGIIEWDRSGRFMNRLEEWHNFSTYNAANLYGTYQKTFGRGHNFKAVLGANYENHYYKNNYAYADDLSSTYINDFKVATGTNYVNGGKGRYVLEGVFGRVNYDWKERYLFELSFRADGSSKFLPGNQWGFFPSVSAGWRMSDEPFWRPLAPVWSSSKLRFSIGQLGNQAVGSYYMFTRSVNMEKQSYLFGGDSPVKGAWLDSPESDELTWENTRHYNLGVDWGFFGDRLNFTGDFFIRETRGMIVDGDILPAVYGNAVPQKNAGMLRSQGYELSLGWKDTFFFHGKPFTYGAVATLGDDTAKLVEYDVSLKMPGSYYPGMTFGEIWGFKTDGYFQTDEEAQEYTSRVDCSQVAGFLHGGWKAGDVKFLDIDGDKEINKGAIEVGDSGDYQIIGNSRPRWQYGITLSAQWNNIDISVFGQGIGRLQRYPQSDNTAFWGPYNRAATYIQKDFMDKCWSETNRDAYYPRPRGEMAHNSSYITTKNDKFLLNLAYFRLKNVSVGYTLPSKLTEKIGLENVRVFATGENLFYLSQLKKINPYIDPEQMSTGSIVLGFTYPWQTTYVLGVDIKF